MPCAKLEKEAAAAVPSEKADNPLPARKDVLPHGLTRRTRALMPSATTSVPVG